MKKLKRVEVKWRDAHSSLSHALPGNTSKIITVISIGWLIADLKDHIELATDYIDFKDGEIQYRTLTAIPRELIVRMRRLRPA